MSLILSVVTCGEALVTWNWKHNVKHKQGEFDFERRDTTHDSERERDECTSHEIPEKAKKRQGRGGGSGKDAKKA